MRDTREQWCEVDGCPSSICGGPHVSHPCDGGYVATQHVDNPAPCPFCGALWVKGGAQ